jgi:hypothetical protein
MNFYESCNKPQENIIYDSREEKTVHMHASEECVIKGYRLFSSVYMYVEAKNRAMGA